ncbi:phage major capsid protein [Lewinella sp. W8]|uniref:phage major capsid protein n=1 Tax=Lewinella sp. W8 TaxID=2528208 RepID=UPI0010679FFA|nr:phage major capsid protein [Lewinella sp. W8]MTB50064.1 phage major capsid protein [Lewinella sp. W8]
MSATKIRTEKEIKEDRAAKVADLEALENKARGREMTNEEQLRFNRLFTEIEDLTGELKQGQRRRQLWAQGADRQDGRTPNRGSRVGRNSAPALLGDMATSLVRGEINRRDGLTFSSNNHIIETDNVLSNIAYQLSTENRLTELGARLEPMANYSVLPVEEQRAQGQHWTSGDQVQADTAMVMSARDIDHKTFVAMVKADKNWLIDGGELARDYIGTSLAATMNEQLIASVLHGSAANKQPDGIDNTAGIPTIDAGGASVTDHGFHLDAVSELMSKNVRRENIGYIYGNKTFRQVAGLTGTDGQPLMPPAAISDLRHFHTTAVKEDYGAGNDQTRMYFGDFSNLLVALGGTFRMELVEKYADTLQTAFLVWMRYDIQVIRPDNFVIVENLSTT